MANKIYNLKKSLYESNKARELLDEEFIEFLPKRRNIQEFFELYDTHFYNLNLMTHDHFLKQSLKYVDNWVNPRLITKNNLRQQLINLQIEIDSVEREHPIIPNGAILSPNEESEWENLDSIELYYVQSSQIRKIHNSELFNQVKEFLKKSSIPNIEIIIEVDRDLLNTMKTGKDIKTEQDIFDSNYDFNTYNSNTTIE